MALKSSRTRNYVNGLFTGYAVTLTTIVVGLWLTPLTLRFLDREEYAIFALTSDILMWLNLLDFGIASGFHAQAARLADGPDEERINRLASTAFFTQLLVVLLVLLAGLAMAFAFPRFFDVRPELERDAIWVMALLALGSAMSLGTQTFSALLVAQQKIHIDNLIRLALIVLRTALTVLLLFWGWKLLSLAVATVVATAITSSLCVVRCFRAVPNLRIRLGLASWDALRSIGGLGIWFSLGGLAGIVIQSLDRTVAARLVSIESVTTLTLTGRVYLLAGGLLAQITNTARPALAQLVGKADMRTALATYRRLFALSTGGAVVAALSLWSGNATFVSAWVGAQNYGGRMLDLALLLNLIVSSWVLPNRATLSAGLIVRPQTTSRLIEGALNLLLSVLLGASFGLIGIAASTAIAGLLTSGWYLPWLTAKMFGRSFLKFLWDDVARIVLLGALLAPVAWWASEIGEQMGGMKGAFLAILMTSVPGAALLWSVGLDRQLQGQLAGIFGQALRTVRRTAAT